MLATALARELPRFDVALIQARSASEGIFRGCLLYTSPSPRDGLLSRMPSSA